MIQRKFTRKSVKKRKSRAKKSKKMYKNITEVCNDSLSPALIVPSPLSPYKVYYSSLRKSFVQLASQEPFSTLETGDSISFLIPNSVEFVIVFLAILHQGAIANPLNPNYTKSEVLFYCGDVKPKAILIPDDCALKNDYFEAAKELNIPLYTISLHGLTQFPKQSSKFIPRFRVKWTFKSLHKSIPSFDPVVQCRKWGTIASQSTRVSDSKSKRIISIHPDTIALFLHTSGTTGRPKLVPLTHKNILTSMSNIQMSYKLTCFDSTYLVMPLFHVHGLIGALLSTFYSGGTIILPPRFSVNAFWNDFIQFKVSNWFLNFNNSRRHGLLLFLLYIKCF